MNYCLLLHRDRHSSEYPTSEHLLLRDVTGFTGSCGASIFEVGDEMMMEASLKFVQNEYETSNRRWIVTDSRYWDQAEMQCKDAKLVKVNRIDNDFFIEFFSNLQKKSNDKIRILTDFSRLGIDTYKSLKTQFSLYEWKIAKEFDYSKSNVVDCFSTPVEDCATPVEYCEDNNIVIYKFNFSELVKRVEELKENLLKRVSDDKKKTGNKYNNSSCSIFLSNLSHVSYVLDTLVWGMIPMSCSFDGFVLINDDKIIIFTPYYQQLKILFEQNKNSHTNKNLVFSNIVNIESALNEIREHSLLFVNGTISKLDQRAAKTYKIEESLSENRASISIKKKNLTINYTALDDYLNGAMAKKSDFYIEAAKKAHVYDGIALSTALMRCENNDSMFTELQICSLLDAERKKSPHYLGKAFDNIVALGSHGALAHYDPKLLFNKENHHNNNKYLLTDSGGAYLIRGEDKQIEIILTDVTRSIIMGGDLIDNSLDDDYVSSWNQVLEGHVLSASSSLPRDRGHYKDLDVFARKGLWDFEKDYGHGTGHGIGYFVHEMPYLSSTKFEKIIENSVFSIEPGFYKSGHYGIRHENLYIARQKNDYYQFDPLTKVPFSKKLLRQQQISQKTLDWVNTYNKNVRDELLNELKKTKNYRENNEETNKELEIWLSSHVE